LPFKGMTAFNILNAISPIKLSWFLVSLGSNAFI